MLEPLLTKETSVPDAIVEALAQAGVRYVVGMPGGNIMPLFASLHGHGSISTILVREESIGSILAEAYGRLTATPLVLMGQGEWIAANAGQGLLEALLGCSPIIILADMTDGGVRSHHGPYQSGSGDYGTWNAVSAFSSVTKRTMVSHHPVQAVQHVQLALKHALTGESGPVAVLFHSAALRGSVGAMSSPRLFPTSAYLPSTSGAIDDRALASAISALDQSHSPVIVAGNGVRLAQSYDDLEQVATLLDAPVVTTSSGKGVFDETHPLSAGVMGIFGGGAANEIVGGADVVLAVGTKLSPSDTVNEHPDVIDPCRQTLIQVDKEPLNAAWTLPVDHVVVGDAAQVLRQIAGAAEPRTRSSAGHHRVAVALDAARDWLPATSSRTASPLLPETVIAVLSDCLPAETVVTCDAGENRLFMQRWFRTRGRGRYLQPAAGGGMGYAIPAALGARLAAPSNPVVAVCGDGGFAMSLHALMTAVQASLPIGVVVFNNGALGWVLHSMRDRAIAADLRQSDHVALAHALGCDGTRATTANELRDAVGGLSELDRPLIIDVPMSLDTSYRDIAQPSHPRRLM